MFGKLNTTVLIGGLIISALACNNEQVAAFGADFSCVVKETLYTTDIEAMKSCNAARKVFYKNNFPAASWVQVSRLYEPTAKLEVDLIAVLPGDEK